MSAAFSDHEPDAQDKDRPLQNDIRLLGQILGNVEVRARGRNSRYGDGACGNRTFCGRVDWVPAEYPPARFACERRRDDGAFAGPRPVPSTLKIALATDGLWIGTRADLVVHALASPRLYALAVA